MNMNAVGIDVSKRKSTVAILGPGGKVVVKPFNVPHLSADFQSLKKLIRELDDETLASMIPEIIPRKVSMLLNMVRQYCEKLCSRAWMC